MRNVHVLGIGQLAAAVRLQLQAGLGAAAEPARESPDPQQALFIACSDFPNPASFRDANARALAAGSRILFVAMTMPRVVQIGPLVAPDRAGCFECVRARRHEVADAGPGPDPIRYAQSGAGVVLRQALAGALTPYKGSPDPERRVARRRAGCRACRARA